MVDSTLPQELSLIHFFICFLLSLKDLEQSTKKFILVLTHFRSLSPKGFTFAVFICFPSLN